VSLTSDLQPDLIILQYCCLSTSLKPVADIIVCFAVLISDCHELYFLRYSFVCAEMMFGSSRVCLSCCSPFRRSQANYKEDTERVVEQSIIHTQRHYWYALSVLFSEPSQDISLLSTQIHSVPRQEMPRYIDLHLGLLVSYLFTYLLKA